MVSFEEAVNQQLCKINVVLEKMLSLEMDKKNRDKNIFFFTVPEDGGTRVFQIGTTKIDFLVGQIRNPDGSIEKLQQSLKQYNNEFLQSLTIEANQTIVLRIGTSPKRTITAFFATQIPWILYNYIEITCTELTNITIFSCTNPQATIGTFKVTTMTIYEQDTINGDAAELATNDVISTLKTNLNRIRFNITQITGEVWGTVSHSIASIWAKFNATTGHAHTGGADDAPKISGSNVTNTPSGSIAATNVQTALNELDAEKIPKAISATDKILGRATAGAGDVEEIACTAAGRALIDDINAAAQRTTLGLGTIATQAANSVAITGGSITGITDLAIADGGTGSSTAAAARLALGLVDANDRMPAAMMPSRELSHYFHASFDEVTVVQGGWNQVVNAAQTDIDTALVGAGNLYRNSTGPANLDEVHFGSISLLAGTYKVIFAYTTANNRGIVEILIGTTLIGTVDTYSAGGVENVVSAFTYSPTAPITGNLRFRVNGKNASSSAYNIVVSRLEIIRTG